MHTVSTQTEQALPLRPAISHEKILFDYLDADLILCSLDSYEFRVLKMYIVHNSPILEEKLLISPTTQHKPISSTISAESGVNSESSLNAHPVVQPHIDGAILFNLLTYIFPVPPALPSTVEQVMELLSVAQMYKMDVVVTYIRNYIAQQEPPLILEETAFLIHSLSQKQALRHEALQAARCALSFTIFTFPDLEKKLDMMPGALLYELWKYRERIRSNLASDLREIKRSDALAILGELKCGSESFTESIPSWLQSHISTIGTDPVFFSDPTDFYMDLGDHRRPEWGSSRGCASCSDIPRDSIRELCETSKAVIHESISKVMVTM